MMRTDQEAPELGTWGQARELDAAILAAANRRICWIVELEDRAGVLETYHDRFCAFHQDMLY